MGTVPTNPKPERLQIIGMSTLNDVRGLRQREASTIFQAPRTPIQETLCEIGAEVLGLERVGIQDNFLELGGDSLDATQFIARVRDVFGVELSLNELFKNPTIEATAAFIEAAAHDRSKHRAPLPPLEPIARDGHLPLSFAQERMWFIHQLDPHGVAYHIVVTLGLTGALNVDALRASFNEVVRRHEALRTTFPSAQGQPVQVIHPALALPLPCIDLRDVPADVREARAIELLQQEVERPFDLSTGPLFRLSLYRLGGEEFVLLLLMHHIISDAWSLGVMMQEVTVLYNARVMPSPPASFDGVRRLALPNNQTYGGVGVGTPTQNTSAARTPLRTGSLPPSTLLRSAQDDGEGSKEQNNNALSLPELPIQAVDFAAWQRGWMQGEILAEELNYWRKQLGGVPALELPTDHSRPPVQTYRGAHQHIVIDKLLFNALQALSQRKDVTLSMTLLAAFKTLLYRYTAQPDIAVGISIANRRWVAVERLISAFVNTLVLRTDLSGDPTFEELLARERQVALDSYAHQDMPFAKLVAELNPERRMNQSPLAQVMFNFINLPLPNVQWHGVTIEPIPLDHGGAQFDLTLAGTDILSLRRLTLEYNTDLFDHATARRMLAHLVNLLHAVVQNPKEHISKLALLNPEERDELVIKWNATEAEYSTQCVHELFEAQVERTPDAIAIRFGNETLSYRELNSRANRLAHELRELGVVPETFVGICTERTPEMIVALLGVLKAGGAYMPLNPTFPKERLAFMLAEARAQIVLTQEHLIGKLPEMSARVICVDAPTPQPPSLVPEGNRALVIERRSGQVLSRREREAEGGEGNLLPVTKLENAAYVIFTSGSTGTPKGVVGLHRGIVNDLQWQWQTYPYEPNEVCALRTPLNFIDSVREIFAPLLQGVTCVLVTDEAVQDQRLLVQALAQSEVTRIAFTPAVLRALFEMEPPIERALPKCKYWFAGGEALPAELCQQFLERMPDRVLVNLYGCSEAAGDSTYFDTREFGVREFVPIGKPIGNTQVYVLDVQRQPVPIGVPGDLYIGGDGLARGYLNQPQLTAEKFIASPFNVNARLYKTGDLACWLPDGNVKYLGRSDQQVKVRGMRVEMGEVERVLRQHEAIADVAILARQDTSQNQQLVAYIVPKTDAPIQTSALRHFLQEHVPHYMIPATFVTLDALPINASGKVDRRALPSPEKFIARNAKAAPHDELERQLQAIWERVLEIHPLGVQDDFFELGGHSLLAVRLFAEIENELGQALPLTALFQAPTIDGLAAELRRQHAVSEWSPLVPIQPNGNRTPFFCVHGLGGGVIDYTRLARLLGADQPFYGLQAYGMEAGQIPDSDVGVMAARFIRAMKQVQPQGPYAIGGYSYGGTVAYEMACQLQAQGETVALLAMFDHPAPYSNYAQAQLNVRFVKGFVQNLPYWMSDYWQLDRNEKWGRITQRVRRRTHSNHGDTTVYNLADYLDDVSHIPQERQALMQRHLEAVARYTPQPYAGGVTVFRTPRQPLLCSHDPHLGWDTLTRNVEVRPIAGFHRNLLQEPHVEVLAAELRVCLAREFDGTRMNADKRR